MADDGGQKHASDSRRPFNHMAGMFGAAIAIAGIQECWYANNQRIKSV
jgi:hypothetical protein